MMSKKIIYLLFSMMVLGLMALPALAATPDHLNLENPLALTAQSRAVDGCPAAKDMLRDPFILAKGPGGGGGNSGSSGGGGNSGSGGGGGNSGSGGGGKSGSNSDGDCCDNGPRGGQGPAEDEPQHYRYQYRHTYRYGEPSQTKAQYGPGDGTGNDGDGPQDGSGFGAGTDR